jgi:chemotaxis signal transduction protein
MREHEMTLRGADELRREFDAVFAAPALTRDVATEALVLLRADADTLVAVRAAELGGIHVCPPIQWLPGGTPAQLGVTGVRGTLTLVLSLCAALGRPPAAAPGRLLALASGDRSVGFAFAGLAGYHQIAQGSARRGAIPDTGPLDEVVELDQTAYPIVSIAALLRAAKLD